MVLRARYPVSLVSAGRSPSEIASNEGSFQKKSISLSSFKAGSLIEAHMRCKSPKPLSAAHLICSDNVSKSGKVKQNVFTLASLFLSRLCFF